MSKPSKPRIPNVLASRYASLSMAQLWSPEYKIVLERRLWLAVLKAQKDLGVACRTEWSRTTSGGGSG